MKDNRLKGVNIGGWLLMEGYLLGGRNIPEQEFKDRFKKIYGENQLVEFENCFYDNFITEDDFKRIASWGANCIRLPFNCRIFEVKKGYEKREFYYLDRAVSWARKYALKIILDLHAAYGSQNCDWHADSKGKAFLWENTSLRKKTYNLWERIADRYKDEEAIYGYDILNEPVIEKKKLSLLKKFYAEVIKLIRSIDKKHVIILEGNLWAQRIDFLNSLMQDNIDISIHVYQPLNFVFNFIPGLFYPGKIDKVVWNKNRIHNYLKPYYDFAKRNKVNLFVGEFGINYRNNSSGELEYLNDLLEVFDEYSFSYTYWTYKAVYGYVFPNGIYQYLPNREFICREGPVFGWENYLNMWKKKKKDIVNSWRTVNFSLNKKVVNILKTFFRN